MSSETDRPLNVYSYFLRKNLFRGNFLCVKINAKSDYTSGNNVSKKKMNLPLHRTLFAHKVKFSLNISAVTYWWVEARFQYGKNLCRWAPIKPFHTLRNFDRRV